MNDSKHNFNISFLNTVTFPPSLGRTGLVKYPTDTGSHPPIRSCPILSLIPNVVSLKTIIWHAKYIRLHHINLWSSSIILVKTKSGTDRFVVYFRRLNSVTRIDSYPLPRIDDALDALNGTKYLSTIDLMYWQLEMEPKWHENAAFIAYGRRYESLVFLFELTNAPSTYQPFNGCVLMLRQVVSWARHITTVVSKKTLLRLQRHWTMPTSLKRTAPPPFEVGLYS